MRRLVACLVVVASTFPGHLTLGAVLPPSPEVASSPDGRFLVVVSTLTEPDPDSEARLIKEIQFRVLEREDAYSMLPRSLLWSQRIRSESRHWSEVGRSWGGTCGRFDYIPFVSNSGQHVVFLTHHCPHSPKQHALSIYEQDGYGSRRVATLDLQSLWTAEEMKDNLLPVCTDHSLPWFKDLGFDFSLDSASFLHTTPSKRTVTTNLAAGRVAEAKR